VRGVLARQQGDEMTSAAPHPQSRNPRGVWRVLAGALVSVAFLWLAFRGVDWAGAWASMAHADGWLLLLGLASVLAGIVLRAERWRLMFYPHHRDLRLFECFSTMLIGQAVNAVAPLRAGEVVRALLIGEIEGVSKALAIWTTVVEKVLDSAALLGLLALASLTVPLPAWVRGASWAMTLGLVIGLVMVAIIVRHEAAGEAWLARLEGRLAWLARLRPARLVAAVTASVRLMRRPGLAAGLLVRSVIVTVALSATNWIVGLGMGLRLPIMAYGLLFATLQISAIVPLPTSPGRLGVFHYLCVVVLGLYGVERDVALAYGLVLHVLVYLPTAVGGPLLLWLENRRGHALGRVLGFGAPAGGQALEL
jgi:glycosyltransferase 2 family protein